MVAVSDERRSRTPSPAKSQSPKKEVKPKKPRAKPGTAVKTSTGPTTSEMVKAAIASIGGRKGVSISAIKKYISANYKIDLSKRLYLIKQYLTKASVEGGELKRMTGVGGNGSFKINKDAIKKPAKKKVVKKKNALVKKASYKNTNNSSAKNKNNNRSRSASKSATKRSLSKSKPRSSSKKATPKKRPSSSKSATKKKTPAKRKSLAKGASKTKVKKEKAKPKTARPKSSKGTKAGVLCNTIKDQWPKIKDLNVVFDNNILLSDSAISVVMRAVTEIKNNKILLEDAN